MVKPLKRIKLHGFNNLTKTLSFNLYDICYAETASQTKAYIDYIDEAYNADRLKKILLDVADIIEAKVLNIAHQDYDPQGASVTMLVAEQSEKELKPQHEAIAKKLSESVVSHLDKSHITVHTYPESHPTNGISTFRADIDVSTCGLISPLTALDYLIHSFESDIVYLDYRVRGFTRDVKGKKHYIDHNIPSIQRYLSKEIQKKFIMVDVNFYQENIFHTKMMLREFNLADYLFGCDISHMPINIKNRIEKGVKKEIQEIFEGRNRSF